MAEDKFKNLSKGDYKKITVEHALGKGQNAGGKEACRWYQQGPAFSLRRVARFTGYSLWSSFPAVIYEQQFSSAYLPFARRYHSLGLATGALLLLYYIKSAGNS